MITLPLILFEKKHISLGNNGYEPPIICPSCGGKGIFRRILIKDGVQELIINNQEGLTHFSGFRICPDKDCSKPVLITWNNEYEVIDVYPPIRIHFQSDNIPEKIIEALSESITCEANKCYIASAIMARKAIEEICLDKGAEGNTLFDRIKSLEKDIVLPPHFIEAMGDLRLLGNDAAHLEARIYEEIGEEEVRVAIDIIKEMLRSIYQMDSILGRLKNLKKPTEK